MGGATCFNMLKGASRGVGQWLGEWPEEESPGQLQHPNVARDTASWFESVGGGFFFFNLLDFEYHEDEIRYCQLQKSFLSWRIKRKPSNARLLLSSGSARNAPASWQQFRQKTIFPCEFVSRQGQQGMVQTCCKGYFKAWLGRLDPTWTIPKVKVLQKRGAESETCPDSIEVSLHFFAHCLILKQWFYFCFFLFFWLTGYRLMAVEFSQTRAALAGNAQ